ncbi:hypothetical protein UJ101_01303 [Flavobacteriaceae bacterium UJ101]|nr:hypothetical protein UJ101_01303 [Flavobacteriaceae bacterium UJ101]
MLSDLFHGIGNLFEASFEILPVLGNIPNFILMVVGATMFIWWMLQLKKFGKEDKEMERPQGRNIN